MGVPLGFFAANAVFLLLGLVLPEAELLAWGWRVPFVLSAALVMLGLWVRLKIAETPEFAEALEREPPVAVPIWQLITRYPGAMLAGSAGVIACYAIFYLATNFALAQATGPLGYPRETFLLIQLFAILFLAAGTVAAAWHADRGSPARTLSLGALLFVPIGAAFGPGLTSGSLVLATLTLCVTLFCMGFTNAPLGGWLSSLFPVRMRYSGVAFAFNFGGILGGAVTPLIAQMMTNAGMGAQVGLLLVLAAALSLGGFRLARAAD
jgi:MFS family permease